MAGEWKVSRGGRHQNRCPVYGTVHERHFTLSACMGTMRGELKSNCLYGLAFVTPASKHGNFRSN